MDAAAYRAFFVVQGHLEGELAAFYRHQLALAGHGHAHGGGGGVLQLELGAHRAIAFAQRVGHARQGSIRAPQWTHGGVALGPKPRSYNYHINNKVKRLALLSVLSDKAANGNMVVVDKFACDEYKTKTVVAMLNAVGAGKKNLLVNETVDAKFVKSAGNIAGVKTTFAGSVNTYDVLNADKLIISVDAAKKLEEVLG